MPFKLFILGNSTKSGIEEGKNLVATRLKHIVLANLHGWDFVTEYKQIPIAEDESDEKRIRKVLIV